MDIDPKRLSTALRDIYAATPDPVDRPLLPHKMAAAFDANTVHTQLRAQVSLPFLPAPGNNLFARLPSAFPAHIAVNSNDLGLSPARHPRPHEAGSTVDRSPIVA
ncbi:MAG TPA: hypothetical protein VHX61_08660 [Rhizomicrobium sp.]|jgi:hypothetical protein|nr:hypothetical protein [Rhizomicrobium sp.]